MPFYLRKSISVGPFRFNLSKSGVGLSVGVRGLRIGTGPRGHYIHAGANGFYYRASLGHPGQKRTPAATALTSSPPRSLPADDVEMTDIESGDVLAMTDIRLQDVVGEINRRCRQVRHSSLLGWISGGTAAAIALAIKNPAVLAIVLPAYLVGRWLDSYRRTTVLFYDLEPTFADAYRRFIEAFEGMARCAKTWHVSAEGKVLDLATWKRNAGAGVMIKRSPASLRLQLPGVVKSNLDPPSVRVGRQELYFFPDMVLVLDGHKAGAVTYDKLQIDVLHARQIESEGVPSDARVVGHTWQHPNKKGGPDRRFAYNKQIPVCLYEELHLGSATGLNELVVLSKLGAAEPFGSVAKALAQYSPAETLEPTQPERLTEQQQERNALGAKKSTVIAAAIASLCLAGIAGLVWHRYAYDARAVTSSRLVHEQPPEPKSAVSTPLPKNLITGSVKQEPERALVFPAEALDVVATLSFQGGHKPVIVGRTNLPTGTELMISLRRKESGYFGQAKVIVASGQFRAGPFTQKGGPLNSGRYLVEVSSPLATLQPASVRAAIGQKGENLRGSATKVTLGERVVAISQDVEVGGGAISAVKDVKVHAQEKKNKHTWWMESCKSKCTLLQGVAAKRKESFDTSKCYLECLADQPRN